MMAASTLLTIKRTDFYAQQLNQNTTSLSGVMLLFW